MNAGYQKKSWMSVHGNPTYFPNSLSEHEGLKIRWHSPDDPESSQVFCVSAFGSIRRLPDGSKIIADFFRLALPKLHLQEDDWNVNLEWIDRLRLGQTGQGTPSSIDVFCSGRHSAICLESKFKHDAREGFGSCGVAGNGKCLGYYGPGSAVGMKQEVFCRLAVKDGRRGARSYWEIGRSYFKEHVFAAQRLGENCPFANSAFQLMRNFLFAAASAPSGGKFGCIAIAPQKTGVVIRKQVEQFRGEMVLPQFQASLGIATYDQLAKLMLESQHEQSKQLGDFLLDCIRKQL